MLSRNFYAEKPNQKWLTDVTEFKIIGSNCKLYLSAILDLYDKSIVAYELSTSNSNNLVFKNFDKAIDKNPNVTEILFHSDRGFQYTNRQFKKKLDDHNFIRSMSRVSRCIDNGPMEGFFGILKSEMYYINKFYSIDQLKTSIDDYIKFYNEARYQKKLK
ncbi:MAG: IS3 family transposase, partial [Anaeroplasmataceae bacterium]